MSDRKYADIISKAVGALSRESGKELYDALLAAAIQLDPRISVPMRPAAYTFDREDAEYLREYLAGAVYYGDLEFEAVRQAIAREIVMFLRDFGKSAEGEGELWKTH